MPRRDTALACLVAVLWGANFVAIHESLLQFPPLFLASLRFALLAVPALLFVKRPQVQVRWLVLYGVGFGILQFVFLYAGMAAGVPAGLASLLLQASAPFTVLLAAALLHERPGRVRLIGIGIAITGFTIIAVTRGLQAQLVPVLLVLAGGLGWAVGNIGARESRTTQPFAFMMWMTVIPPVPLLLLSLAIEGPARISESVSTSFTASALPAWIGLAYTVLLSTVVGTSIWSMLMGRNPSSSVAPFSMLVPVAGFLTAGLVLGERPAPGDLAGGVLVILGVLLPTLGLLAARAGWGRVVVEPEVPAPSPGCDAGRPGCDAGRPGCDRRGWPRRARFGIIGTRRPRVPARPVRPGDPRAHLPVPVHRVR